MSWILLQMLRLLGTQRSASVWLSGSHVFGVWVLHAGVRKLDSSRDVFSWAMLGSTVDTCSASARDAYWTIFTYFLRCRGLDC